LLQEQSLAYVEGALKSTNPGRAFTVGVLAALPLSAISAKAVTAGAAVKGSSTVKTVTGLATLGAIFLFHSLLGFLAVLGACVGYAMSRSCAKSTLQCENVIQFWRTMALGFAGCIIIPQLWSAWTLMQHHAGPWDPHYWIVSRVCPDLFDALAVAALAMWMWRWWHDLAREKEGTQELARPLKRRFVVWLWLGMIGPACLFVLLLVGMLCESFGPAREQQISDAAAQEIIGVRKDAVFMVRQNLDDGTKTVRIYLPENSLFPSLEPTLHNGITARDILPGFLSAWAHYRPVELWAVANESTLKALDEKKIHYGITAYSGRISSREAWLFQWMISFFMAPMGAVILLRQIGKGQCATTTPGVSETLEEETSKYGRMLLAGRTDPRAQRIFGIAFAAVFLVVFSANALTSIGVYVVMFVGLVKGAFFGLVAGVGVLYLRTRRNKAMV
jgi:hypothetical protein